MKKLIVSKFGGSSLKDAEAIRRSAEIALNNADTAIVCVSATQKTTRKLIELSRIAASDIEMANVLFLNIKQAHFKIAEDLKLKQVEIDQLDLIFEVKGF